MYQRLCTALLPSVTPGVSAFLGWHIPIPIVVGVVTLGLFLGGLGVLIRSRIPESSIAFLLIGSSLLLFGGAFPPFFTAESAVLIVIGLVFLGFAIQKEAQILRRVPHHPPHSYLYYVIGFQGAAAAFCLTASFHYVPLAYFWCGIGLGSLVTLILGTVAFRMEQGWRWAPR